MDIIKKGFGNKLKNIRKDNNLTQEKFAELIEINVRQLARIEAGESFVTSETLFKICKILQISPQSLFNFEIEEIQDIDAIKMQVENDDENYLANIYNNIVNKIKSEKNNKLVLEFIEIALESLNNKVALEKLKLLLKGMELKQ